VKESPNTPERKVLRVHLSNKLLIAGIVSCGGWEFSEGVVHGQHTPSAAHLNLTYYCRKPEMSYLRLYI
jgi:hypothetical protein